MASIVSRVEKGAFGRPELDDAGNADIELLRSMARGDHRALSAFYGRHGGIALALAQRMLDDTGAAEEAVQDAFVSVWRRAASFRTDSAAARTWLLTIVRNRCIDELRRRRNQPRLSFDDSQPQLVDELWPEIWKRQFGEAVRSALDALPREQREVIELGFYDGYSHAQIAAKLSAPLGTVKKRMRSGLARLRGALDERLAEGTP